MGSLQSAPQHVQDKTTRKCRGAKSPLTGRTLIGRRSRRRKRDLRSYWGMNKKFSPVASMRRVINFDVLVAGRNCSFRRRSPWHRLSGRRCSSAAQRSLVHTTTSILSLCLTNLAFGEPVLRPKVLSRELTSACSSKQHQTLYNSLPQPSASFPELPSPNTLVATACRSMSC